MHSHAYLNITVYILSPTKCLWSSCIRLKSSLVRCQEGILNGSVKILTKNTNFVAPILHSSFSGRLMFILPSWSEDSAIQASKRWCCYKERHDPRHDSQRPVCKRLQQRWQLVIDWRGMNKHQLYVRPGFGVGGGGLALKIVGQNLLTKQCHDIFK